MFLSVRSLTSARSMWRTFDVSASGRFKSVPSAPLSDDLLADLRLIGTWRGADAHQATIGTSTREIRSAGVERRGLAWPLLVRTASDVRSLHEKRSFSGVFPQL